MTYYDPSLSRDQSSGSWQETLFSHLHGGLDRLERYLDQRRHDKEQRDAFKTLLTLEERLLDDIGLTRDDVEWASRLPVHVNAANALRHLHEDRGI